jgi:diguanylate cyclase (GGDEF)-like protein
MYPVTDVDPAPGRRPIRSGPGASPTAIRETADAVIAVYASSAEFEALRRALSPMPHVVVMPAIAEEGMPPAAIRCAAAVVADSIENSLELCARVSKTSPVVFVTQNSGFDIRLAAMRAGVGALVPRPFDANELIGWLEHLVDRQCNGPYSVLIVDDDPVLADLYATALRHAGMEVHAVQSASTAFELLDAALPDLILMDLRMPGADGIEISRMIRQYRRYLSVPIVFVSAESDSARQMEARKFGGDEFISKPVDLNHLVALVRLRAERAKVMRSAMERDSLTGLLNHGRFKERLAHEMERCHRTGGEISLAMIDLDRFKTINDTHGHLIGDRVIRTLSHSLASGLRRIDIVGRYGGEAFGVIMLDTSPHLAHAAIEKQRRRFGEIEFDAAGRRFHASFSAGVAGSRTCTTVEKLISAADRALYAAKRAGRDRAVVGMEDEDGAVDA